MAAGARLLDATGKRLLYSDGKVPLVNATSECPNCGCSGCTCCLPTASSVSVTFPSSEVCLETVGCAFAPVCFPDSVTHQRGYHITFTFAAGTYTLALVSGSGCTTGGTRSRIYQTTVTATFTIRDILVGLCPPDTICQTFTKSFILRATYQVAKSGSVCSRQYDVVLIGNDTDAAILCGPCGTTGTIIVNDYRESWRTFSASACDPVSGPHTLNAIGACTNNTITLDEI